MNNMPKATKARVTLKKQSKIPTKKRELNEKERLRAFANTVGDFIRYWGFRRIHGQIWALVYLSKQPLSGALLTEMLGVSKALVSPALSELLDHKLILSAGGDLKTKFFVANSDVMSIITNVLSTRETTLLKNAQVKITDLTQIPESEMINIDVSRLTELESMISTARVGLFFILKNMKQGDLNFMKILVASQEQ